MWSLVNLKLFKVFHCVFLFFLSSSRIWHILKNYISYAYNKTAIVHIGRVDRGNSEIQPDSFGSCYCWVHRVWLLTHWHTLLSPNPLGWNPLGFSFQEVNLIHQLLEDIIYIIERNDGIKIMSIIFLHILSYGYRISIFILL